VSGFHRSRADQRMARSSISRSRADQRMARSSISKVSVAFGPMPACPRHQQVKSEREGGRQTVAMGRRLPQACPSFRRPTPVQSLQSISPLTTTPLSKRKLSDQITRVRLYATGRWLEGCWLHAQAKQSDMGGGLTDTHLHESFVPLPTRHCVSITCIAWPKIPRPSLTAQPGMP
jgi:hypothetical protein